MAFDLGALRAKLGLNIDDFNRGLSDAEKQLGKFGDRAGKISDAIVALGTGAAAIGLFHTVEGWVKAADEADIAFRKLQLAIARTGRGIDLKEFDALYNKLMVTANVEDEVAQSTTAMLLRFGATGEQIKRILPVVADMAAGTGNLEGAATAIARALSGNYRMLLQYGVVIDEDTKKTLDAATGSERLDYVLKQLDARVGGTAALLRDSYGGALEQIKIQSGEFSEALGDIFKKDFIEGAEALAAAMRGITIAMSEAPPVVKAAIEFSVLVGGAALTGAALAKFLGFLGIAVGMGPAALVAGAGVAGYEIGKFIQRDLGPSAHKTAQAILGMQHPPTGTVGYQEHERLSPWEVEIPSEATFKKMEEAQKKAAEERIKAQEELNKFLEEIDEKLKDDLLAQKEKQKAAAEETAQRVTDAEYQTAKNKEEYLAKLEADWKTAQDKILAHEKELAEKRIGEIQAGIDLIADIFSGNFGAAGGKVGGNIGELIGATIGGTLGSLAPGIGTIIGSAAGSEMSSILTAVLDSFGKLFAGAIPVSGRWGAAGERMGAGTLAGGAAGGLITSVTFGPWLTLAGAAAGTATGAFLELATQTKAYARIQVASDEIFQNFVDALEPAAPTVDELIAVMNVFGDAMFAIFRPFLGGGGADSILKLFIGAIRDAAFGVLRFNEMLTFALWQIGQTIINVTEPIIGYQQALHDFVDAAIVANAAANTAVEDYYANVRASEQEMALDRWREQHVRRGQNAAVEETTDAFNDLNDEMRNLPSWYRTSAYQAGAASRTIGPVQSARVTYNFYVERIVSTNPRETFDNLQAEAKRRSYATDGGIAGYRDAAWATRG